MKKVNLKNFLVTLSMALAFLFVGIGQAEAQSQISTIDAGNSQGVNVGSNPKSLMVPPNGSFVSQAEALAIIEDHISVLKPQLDLFPSGTATYSAIEKEILYYDGIYNALLKGYTVAEAIVQGFFAFTDAYGPVSNAAKVNLKQSAIDKLSA